MIYIYLILIFGSNVFISHKITDVSSDPVSRYCDCCGTIMHVTAPLCPGGCDGVGFRQKKTKTKEKLKADDKNLSFFLRMRKNLVKIENNVRRVNSSSFKMMKNLWWCYGIDCHRPIDREIFPGGRARHADMLRISKGQRQFVNK